MTILVTGALGYIGSHITLELLKQDYKVILVDNLANSKISVLKSLQELSGKDIVFYKTDILSKPDLDNIFSSHQINGVIHLAAFKSVSESISNPLLYYKNNIGGLLNILGVMKDHDVKNIVFSSSATVYGNNNKSPLTEEMALSTINPYGSTKLVCEGILKELYNSDNTWKINILRYFNPVGADQSGLIGEDPTNIPTNIMPIINNVAIGKIPMIKIFGNDYDTPDGTCIRDFIHVTDLARGHIKAIENDELNSGLNIYNLGTGRGYSVLELINTFEKVTGANVPYEFDNRRPGDIDICFANSGKALAELNWKAEFDLEEMCIDAWRWERNNTLKSR